MSLDQGKASNPLSDGMRCQYNDPDGTNSNNPGDAHCFLGFVDSASNGFDWHVHRSAGPASPPRAYTGVQSLHWGVHGASSPADDTTRLSQLDAIETTSPINLASIQGNPTLRFDQQVSFVDNRALGVFSSIPTGETLDRGVVQVQLADNSGQPIGDWVTIEPYYNRYDVQATSSWNRCAFDPTDDGSDEDSFFSAKDILRKTGPSSTCYTRTVFGWQGDTSDAPFNAANVGRATDGPGLQGSVDRGTWVETRFNLQRYAGRRIRLRLLATSGKYFDSGNDAVSYFGGGLVPAGSSVDDGWYVDNVHVDEALQSPLIVAVDTKANLSLPPCSQNCASVLATIDASPQMIDPPQPVLLDATPSVADICLDGGLQYQFWVDTNRNFVVGDAGDVMVKDWTDDFDTTTIATNSTQYGTRVRCSSAPSCQGSYTDPVLFQTPGEVTNTFYSRNAGTLTIHYTPTCDAAANSIIYGPLPGSSYSGRVCGIGNTGTAVIPDPCPLSNCFYLVVANDNKTGNGTGYEGSYGTKSPGVERPAFGPGACTFAKVLSNRCD